VSVSFVAGKIMHKSAEELLTYFQSDMMLDFGFADDYVVQSLMISMQELQRMKMDLPPAPRPGDAEEKPMKPFGCFEPPSVEQLIASMQLEGANGVLLNRASIPPDGGPVIVPDGLLQRNMSDWSVPGLDNDDVSSSRAASVIVTDCPSSRTSLVSSLLDNIGGLSAANEPSITSFTAAECTVSRTTLTDHSIDDVDQISNSSRYDNVPPSDGNGGDEFCSAYERELEQTLESIEQEIQELLGVRDKHNEPAADELYSPSITAVTSPWQQNHLNHQSYTCQSPSTELPARLDNVVYPSAAVTHATRSVPIVSRSDSSSSPPSRQPDESIVIPIQHLPSVIRSRQPPPVKPKPRNVSLSSAVRYQPPSPVLTPIPVLHLRTVPIDKFTGLSANRPVPVSSTD